MKNKVISVLFLTAIMLVTSALPAGAYGELTANPVDAYADRVYDTSYFNMYNAAATSGAPDEQYGQFFGSDTWVTLDMGEGEEGTGDLKLHMVLLDFGAYYRVEFLDAQLTRIEQASGFFPLNTPILTLDYLAEGTPYRYVRVHSVKTNIWKLDAVEAVKYVGQDPITLPPPAPVEDEQPTAATDTTITLKQGDLIRLPNDGDSSTQYDSSVYVIGADNKRHAFPSQKVFESWYENFNTVREVDAQTMASYTLGKNVTVRPGTYLVKVANDPKTYAVEEGGKLRWIKQEYIAIQLYGDDWAKRVIDVPDVFFGNYALGNVIDSAVHPGGTIHEIKKDGTIKYIRNGMIYTVPRSVQSSMRLQTRFFTSINADLLKLYLDAGDLPLDQTLLYPF